jgi:hypothetical protein
LFSKLDTIKTAVETVEAIKYAANETHSEIPDYPAYQVEDNVDVELEKIAVNGQIYNATMRFPFWLHVPIEWTETELMSLFDSVIQAIAGVSGVNYVKVTKGRRTFWQMGSYKTRSISATVEILTKEAWV